MRTSGGGESGSWHRGPVTDLAASRDIAQLEEAIDCRRCNHADIGRVRRFGSRGLRCSNRIFNTNPSCSTPACPSLFFWRKRKGNGTAVGQTRIDANVRPTARPLQIRARHQIWTVHGCLRTLAAAVLLIQWLPTSTANFVDRSPFCSDSVLSTPRPNRKPFTAPSGQDFAQKELNQHISRLKTIAQDDFERSKLEGHLHQLKSMAQDTNECSINMRHLATTTPAPEQRALRSETPDMLLGCSSTTPYATPELRRRPVHGFCAEVEDDTMMSEATPIRSRTRRPTRGERPVAAVCFDFDKTLSAEHVHNLCESTRAGVAGVDLVQAFGGPERVRRLQGFFGALRARGAALYIVSRGYRARIEQALRGAGLGGWFGAGEVKGWEELRAEGHAEKRECAGALGRRAGLGRERVLLVDDDEEQLWGVDWECDEGGGACEGYWVQGARGLTAADMTKILHFVDAAACTHRTPDPAAYSPAVVKSDCRQRVPVCGGR